MDISSPATPPLTPNSRRSGRRSSNLTTLSKPGRSSDAAKGDRYEALYVLCLMAGLRQGEALEVVRHRPRHRDPSGESPATARQTRRREVRDACEHANGERELYRLDSDPFELINRYSATNSPSGLASRLKALKTCAADAVAPAVTCQVAEGGK